MEFDFRESEKRFFILFANYLKARASDEDIAKALSLPTYRVYAMLGGSGTSFYRACLAFYKLDLDIEKFFEEIKKEGLL